MCEVVSFIGVAATVIAAVSNYPATILQAYFNRHSKFPHSLRVFTLYNSPPH